MTDNAIYTCHYWQAFCAENEHKKPNRVRGRANLHRQQWGRAPPGTPLLAAQLRHSCWSHREVLSWWCSKATLCSKKKRFFGKEWAVQVFAYVCIGWICHSWEARLLFKSVEGRGLERRCLNVSYWCVENNQLNLVLHCELFAALQQQRKSCTEQSFAVCRWACSLTNQTFVALRVPIAVKNMCAQVGAC